MRGGLVKLNQRNTASRVFHVKNDRDAVAAWRMALDRILQTFNVRLTTLPLPTLLTTHFQTELALHTHVAVFDIHRTMVKGQEGNDIGDQTVGIHNALFLIVKTLQLPRLEPGLQFRL